jgi:hypothetical protein
MNSLIIIKPRPGDNRGRLRGYTVTQIANGKRRVLDVMALNGREAVELVRGAQPTTREAA